MSHGKLNLPNPLPAWLRRTPPHLWPKAVPPRLAVAADMPTVPNRQAMRAAAFTALWAQITLRARRMRIDGKAIPPRRDRREFARLAARKAWRESAAAT